MSEVGKLQPIWRLRSIKLEFRGVPEAPKEAPRDLKRATTLIDPASTGVNFGWLGLPKYTYFVCIRTKCRTAGLEGLEDCSLGSNTPLGTANFIA